PLIVPTIVPECIRLRSRSSNYPYPAHPDLHSFPTRRSSDLLLRPCSRLLRLHLEEKYGVEIVRRHAVEGDPEIARSDEECWNLADRKSTRLNSSHQIISYAVFCLKKKRASGYYRR